MLYPKCPSCKTILANKQLIFEAEMKKICEKKLSDDQQDKLKRELLDKLELKRYCCRQRMLTYTDLIDIIQ